MQPARAHIEVKSLDDHLVLLALIMEAEVLCAELAADSLRIGHHRAASDEGD